MERKMTGPVQTMLERYNCSNLDEYRNAFKEIIQEITLLGLSRTNFFNKAAFYGGTALRMFHGLQRFSEDLDFSLLKKDDTFLISTYFQSIVDELGSYGFEMNVSQKEKSQTSAVQSAFIKGGTLVQVLSIYPADPPVFDFHSDEQIRIKFEIDTNPPDGASFQQKTRLLPVLYSAKLYDLPSLFAGKLHALLCRKWKKRVKGRDFYDYLWYLQKGISVNLEHLRNRMVQSGHFDPKETLNRDILLEMLSDRFSQVEFKQVIADIQPFIKDIKETDLWTQKLFIGATKEYLKA